MRPSPWILRPRSPGVNGHVLAGGQLTLTLVSNAEPRDLLTLTAEAFGTNRLVATSNSVAFDNTTFATYSGGSSNSPLTFSFNAETSASAVQALLQNVAFGIQGFRATNAFRTIELQLTDGQGSSSAPVQVRVQLNHRPTAGADRIATGTNLPVFISYTRILANDADVDGDAFSLIAVDTTNVLGGTLQLATNGLTFTPLTGFAGAGQVTYQLQDVHGALNTGAITVQVLVPGELYIEDLPQDPTAVSHACTIALMGLPSLTYSIHASADLVTWTNLTSVLIPQDGFLRYHDADAVNYSIRFYRATQP